MTRASFRLAAGIALVAGVAALPAHALAAGRDHVAPVTAYFDQHVASWIADPVLVDAIKAQNAENARLAQADIDAADKEWRKEVESDDTHRPLVDKVMASPLSHWLKQKQRAAGWMVVEMIVMDDKGLNVGISTPTSDYWQGDEGKFQKTYGTGAEATFVDDVEYDPDARQLLAQINRTVIDPATGKPIGAVTVSINLNKL